MFNIDLNTILAQLINFLVLAGLLYFLLFKNAIKRGKEQREKSRESHRTVRMCSQPKSEVD
jgi:F0F1-type ATP synthase membrane subunit b/b'